MTKETAVLLNLTKSSLPVFSITALVEGESPRNVLPYEFNTLEKLFGDSLEQIAEMMCSIYDLHVVRKEMKYSSCKNEEN